MSAQRMPRPELRRLAAEMAALGWTWERCGSGHIRWMHAEVLQPVFTSGTPRVRSGMAEERAKLRRALRHAREGIHRGALAAMADTAGEGARHA